MFAMKLVDDAGYVMKTPFPLNQDQMVLRKKSAAQWSVVAQLHDEKISAGRQSWL
nr:hypothetical protein [Methylomarinum sp. Ch1-1]MDP4519146.1 hypothetical protein [Methylomarinum sp. Ch1-1]